MSALNAARQDIGQALARLKDNSNFLLVKTKHYIVHHTVASNLVDIINLHNKSPK